MDARLLVESKMMSSEQFGLGLVPKEPLCTIASVGIEVQEESKKKERWGVINFREEWARPLKLNRTSQKALILCFGTDTDKWIGKRIRLIALEGIYFNKRGTAVRINGSPDISKPVSFAIKAFGGGKDHYTIAVMSVAKAGAAQAAPAASSSAPTPDPTTGPNPHPPQPQDAPVSAPSPRAARAPDVKPSGGEGVRAVQPGEAPSSAPASGTAGPAPWPMPTTPTDHADWTHLIKMGPFKGKPIAQCDSPQILETVAFGEGKISAEPNASWRKGVEDQITKLRGVLEQRYLALQAVNDAAAAGGGREPGSDDGEVPSTVPPF